MGTAPISHFNKKWNKLKFPVKMRNRNHSHFLALPQKEEILKVYKKGERWKLSKANIY